MLVAWAISHNPCFTWNLVPIRSRQSWFRTNRDATFKDTPNILNQSEETMDYVRWAERYDIFYEAAPEGELEFYLNAIDRCEGSVLELGVGTGRIAIPAAAMGHDVMGVDVNRPMLDRARLKSTAAPLPGKLQLIEGNMSKIDLPSKEFDLVIIPAHTLALVTDERGQSETLMRCAKHMVPNATLIFNLFNPSDDLIHGDPDETFLLGVVEDDENGVRHVLTGTNEFDTTHQTNRCTQVIETLNADGESIDREELKVVFRYLHHHQVLEMLEKAGLQAIEVFGDFDGSPLTDDSEEMIYICQLK